MVKEIGTQDIMSYISNGEDPAENTPKSQVERHWGSPISGNRRMVRILKRVSGGATWGWWTREGKHAELCTGVHQKTQTGSTILQKGTGDLWDSQLHLSTSSWPGRFPTGCRGATLAGVGAKATPYNQQCMSMLLVYSKSLACENRSAQAVLSTPTLFRAGRSWNEGSTKPIQEWQSYNPILMQVSVW